MREKRFGTPSDDVGFLLKSLTNKMDSTRTNKMHHLEITASQFEVLLFLIENKDEVIHQNDIEKALNRSNPTITGIVQRLESKGFIKRISNDKDRRFKQIVVTEKGMKLHEEGERNRAAGEEALLRGISYEDRAILKRCMKQMIENVNNEKEKWDD